MECKHNYYQYVKGELVCSVCGKPAKDGPAIEDKMAERTEVKESISISGGIPDGMILPKSKTTIYPTESKRLSKKRR